MAYLGKTVQGVKLSTLVNGAVHKQDIVADGVSYAYNLLTTPASTNHVEVHVNGVYVHKSEYVVTGSVITFSSLIPVDYKIEIVVTDTPVEPSSVQTGTVYTQRFSGNSVLTSFTLAATPASENNTTVFINGVYIQKNEYSLSGNVITFFFAPAAGTENIEVNVMSVLPVGTIGSEFVDYQVSVNGSVATVLGSVGPIGSTAGTPQGWLKFKISGIDRFVPYW